jgi:hypothetical protein
MVFSSFCRLADNPYAIGDEGPIDLFELGDVSMS